MKKTLMSVALASALAIGFTGCAGGSNPTPQIVKVDNVPNIKYTANYVDTISSEPILKEDIKLAIKFKLGNGQLDKRRFNSDCQDYNGEMLNVNDSSIDINYYSGRKCNYETFKNPNGTITYFNVNIPYEINGNKNKFDLTFKFPDTYTYREAVMLGFKKVKPVDTPNMLLFYSKRTYGLLNDLSISRSYDLKGEVTSKFDSNSIKGNFDRLLSYGLLKYNNNTYKINYEIFPYRSGSKVQYDIPLSYTLKANGTSTLTNKDLENIKKEVEKIVND